MNLYEELMQEPPGGGSSQGDQAFEFLRAGGWQVFNAPKLGVARSGASAHRGVIHPDEHVDRESLGASVAEKLGFTIEEIETAFSNGRPSLQRASLRARIDARLLALSHAGGNMLALARALGWEVADGAGSSGPTCWKLRKSLERARAAEALAVA